MALINNPVIQRAELQNRREKIDFRQARQNVFPAVESHIEHSFNQGRTIDPTTNQFIDETIFSGDASLSAGVTLFNGLRSFHDIRKKAAAEKAGKLDYEAQKEILTLDVMEAYITVLTAKDLLKQAEDQLLLAQEQFSQSEILHEEGNIDPGDYHDLRGEYNEIKNRVAVARQNLFHSRVNLSGLLHLSEEELPELQTLPIPEKSGYSSASELFERGRERPFFALWEWRIREAEQNIKVAQAGFYPSLSLHTGMNSRYSNSSNLNFREQTKNNFGKYISLHLRIPIFNGFNMRNSVERAKIDLDDVLWQKALVVNSLREASSKAVFDLKIAEEAVENLREQEKQYEESFRIAQVKFDLVWKSGIRICMKKRTGCDRAVNIWKRLFPVKGKLNSLFNCLNLKLKNQHIESWCTKISTKRWTKRKMKPGTNFYGF